MSVASRVRGRVDARLFVLLNNALLLVLGMAYTGLQRDTSQLALALVTGVAAELVLARWTNKHAVVRVWDRVLSSAVTAVSTMVLVRSDVWWFYAALTGAAVLSKYVIVDESGAHVFNPTNFAIVLAVALLPHFISVRPDDFGGATVYRVMIPCFGLLAALRGARLRATVGYYVAVALGIPVGGLYGLSRLWTVAPELNTSTLIFAFLMLTDPKVTPKGARAQLLFGAAVGTVHLFMRYYQIAYSPFVALFGVTALVSLPFSGLGGRGRASYGAPGATPAPTS